MTGRNRKERYKGFEIEYSIVPTGFNTYTISIRRSKEKGRWFFYQRISTYTSKLIEARKIAKKYIDGLGRIKWNWNGREKYDDYIKRTRRLKK